MLITHRPWVCARAPDSDDDIFSGAAADSAAPVGGGAEARAESPAPDPLAEPPQGLGSGAGAANPSSAVEEAAAERRASGAAAGAAGDAPPDPKPGASPATARASGERADAMDEERRARLRQARRRGLSLPCPAANCHPMSFARTLPLQAAPVSRSACRHFVLRACQHCIFALRCGMPYSSKASRIQDQVTATSRVQRVLDHMLVPGLV